MLFVKYYQVLIFLRNRFGNESSRTYESMWTVSNTGQLRNQHVFSTMTRLWAGIE